jgi:type IV secretory pathway protease TraF
MATATMSKPKAARTIVSTKITVDGVQTTLSKSAGDTIGRAMDLCSQLRNVPTLTEKADAAHAALDTLRKAV